MKHLLLSATLLLLGGNLIAQTTDLHVSPNTTASTDSYIYANDVVLYVENGIDLDVNNDSGTKASIYLRGDSQLIQGDKPGSQNSGNGHLSVWQRGYANAYDYNYWASPVGNPNDAAIPTGNTNFGIPRIFDVREDAPNELHKTRSTQQQTTWDLNGVASNVAEGDDGLLQISRRWIYTMRAATGYTSWAFIGHQNGIGVGNGLAPGEGFTMKGTGTTGYAVEAHHQLYDFRGRPNDGDITITVAHDGTNFQETLTGNPYPSALDMAAFLMDSDNSDIEATAYYWDQSRTTNSHYIYDYQGGYGAWIPLGGGDGNAGAYSLPIFEYIDGYGSSTGTGTGESGDPIERRYAPIGQGFMVRGHSSIGAAGTGTAIFKNSMRRHVRQSAATLSQFRNVADNGSTLTTDGDSSTQPTEPQYAFPTVRIHAKVNDLYVRDMVLIFSPETTKGDDRGWDGKHPSLIPNGDTYWKLDGETHPYVIQSRPFDYYDIIPLGLKVKNGSNSFKLNVVEQYGFEELAEETGNAVRMYLYDKVNNHYQYLRPGQEATINYSGNAGKIEDRFFIVFRRDIQSPDAFKKEALATVGFFQNNRLSQLEVSNPEVIDIKNASVFDMSGKLVINEHNLGEQQRYTFSTANLSSGVYLVKLTTADDLVIDYKVTVHNKN